MVGLRERTASVESNPLSVGHPALQSEFERCWPWIEASLEFGAYKHNGKIWPTHGKKHVWDRIYSGRAFFWPGKDCVFITEFINSPTGLKSHHNWLAGGDLDEIKSMMPVIEAWGKKHGCHRQLGSGRRGWLRAFDGYEEIGVRKQKDLHA